MQIQNFFVANCTSSCCCSICITRTNLAALPTNLLGTRYSRSSLLTVFLVQNDVKRYIYEHSHTYEYMYVCENNAVVHTMPSNSSDHVLARKQRRKQICSTQWFQMVFFWLKNNLRVQFAHPTLQFFTNLKKYRYC